MTTGSAVRNATDCTMGPGRLVLRFVCVFVCVQTLTRLHKFSMISKFCAFCTYPSHLPWHIYNQSNTINILIACWVKFSVDSILNFFSHFSLRTGFDISCKLSQDNLHDLSNPVFWKKKRKKKKKEKYCPFVIC